MISEPFKARYLPVDQWPLACQRQWLDAFTEADLFEAPTLAKNAGTSVNQIERFYARNLPLSAEMARNLQSFGGEN